MFLNKKRIDNKISCHLMRYSDIEPESNSKALVYSLFGVHEFFKKFRDEFDSIAKRFILAVNEKFCTDCHWHICTEDHYPYPFQRNDLEGLIMTVLSKYPYVSYFDIDNHYFFNTILNSMNESVFTMLKDTPFTEASTLNLNVTGLEFTAYYPDNKIELDADEATTYFDDKKMEIRFLNGIYETLITFNPNRHEYVKSCMIEAFGSHGVHLDFFDELLSV